MKQYWEHTYEDVLDVIAKMPEVAALIYRCKFKDGIVKKDTSLDYTGNYCSMMGYNDKDFQDLMRLYLVIHSVSTRKEHGAPLMSTHSQYVACRVILSSMPLQLPTCCPLFVPGSWLRWLPSRYVMWWGPFEKVICSPWLFGNTTKHYVNAT